MKTLSSRVLLLLALAFTAPCALADYYELRNIYPKDELVYREASGMAAATIIIRLKAVGSGSIATPLCDAVLDFGDGTEPRTLRLGVDGKVLVENPHRYSRAGTFTFSVRGAETRSACAGRTSGQIEVREASEKPPSTSVARPNAQANAAALPTVTLETRPTSSKDICPEGWQLLPGTMAGGRFTCQIKPVQAFTCPNGTQFFEAVGSMGCR